jgi:para-aminobenzoate synthetase
MIGALAPFSGAKSMKTLLIDNHDSFTYNLFQLLAEVNGQEPFVVGNDEPSWAEIAAGRAFDNVVISAGPGHPDRGRDFGVCTEAIRRSEVPLLGVCLGHQGLCSAYGARVEHAPEPMHGRLATILHDGSSLFAGLPPEFEAVRYHSLCVEQPLPDELRPIAWTADGVLMAVAHRSRPQWGLQFHPESICTEHGRALIERFRDLTKERGARSSGVAALDRERPKPPAAVGSELELRWERTELLPDPERAFAHLYGESRTAFWLDSSALAHGARFSFIGDAAGPLAATVAYDAQEGELRISSTGRTTISEESLFDYLAREMRRLRPLSEDLPFDFDCGFVGYLGYELKADCGGESAHRSPLPDAHLVLADRMIAFDHLERCAYVLGFATRGETEALDGWIAATIRRLAALPPLPEPGPATSGERDSVELRLSRSHRRYIEDIEACKRHLTEGETYEICLTNRIEAEVAAEPLTLYRRLRRANPAPFSAYLRIGEAAVLSSSPERFLSIGRDRWVEAKPIKGTRERGDEEAEDARLAEALRASEKDRAENLTITDLLRNDLGVVCEVGTVHVPRLMAVESFETVHQLVSTVRGRLREELQPPDCVRACFPPGSMTGAPKKRTMELLDRLEGEARGVYSGAIGYLGLGGGCDLSVAIRTIVLDGETASIGAGGAIVTQSEPEEEWRELLLKAAAPIRAIDPALDLQEALGGPLTGSGVRG